MIDDPPWPVRRAPADDPPMASQPRPCREARCEWRHAGSLHAKQGSFRIGEVTEAGGGSPPEIFRRKSSNIFAHQPLDRSVGINENEVPASRRQIVADRGGELDEVLDAAAVDQLGAWDEAL